MSELYVAVLAGAVAHEIGTFHEISHCLAFISTTSAAAYSVLHLLKMCEQHPTYTVFDLKINKQYRPPVWSSTPEIKGSRLLMRQPLPMQYFVIKGIPIPAVVIVYQ